MITVKLKVSSQVMADYLRYLFPPDTDGYLAVSSVTPMGKLLIAHCRTSGLPIKELTGDDVISLKFPSVSSSQGLLNKFLYYTACDIASLNQALSAVFDIDFTGYYRKGEGLGFQKKEIVEAFILSRGLVSKDCFDSLHKRVYRAEQKYMAALQTRLLRKVYYIEESINTKGLK